MSRAQTLTGAFRQHIIAMPLGTRWTTTDSRQWVAANIATLGSPAQTQFTAEASCRCASQRLIVEGWLVRIGECGLYERTGKAVRS